MNISNRAPSHPLPCDDKNNLTPPPQPNGLLPISREEVGKPVKAFGPREHGQKLTAQLRTREPVQTDPLLGSLYG